MFYPTCGMGDTLSMTTGGSMSWLPGMPPPPPPPPPPPAVVQVSTPNVVQTNGSSMPGGDIQSQYMPQAAPMMKLSFGPQAAAIVACLQKKGTWNATTGTCRTAPPIALLFGNLFAKTSTPLYIPPASRPATTNKILFFGGGGAPGVAQGTPEIGFEQRNGLWIVSAAAQPVLQAALGNMVFTATDPAGNAGQANFMLPQASLPGVSSDATLTAAMVVASKIAAGQAALIDKSSVSTGVLKLVFTNDPAVVAQLAGPTGAYALVTDKPDAVVAGALAKVNGGTVPPAAVASTPWLAIGVVAAGVLIAGALMFRKPARATANASKPGWELRREHIRTREEMGASYEGSKEQARHRAERRALSARKAAATRRHRATR